MNEKRIWVDLMVRATLPADSNFSAIVIKNCPNRPNIPPIRRTKISDVAVGSTLSWTNNDIIDDVRNPTIAKHVIGIVTWRSAM